MIQFRRDKRNPDQWNVFGPASEVVIGEVTVTKKSGETQRKRVVAVSRPFDVDGVPHVYGYLARKEDRIDDQQEPPPRDEEQPPLADDDLDSITF